ncbi:S1C family serine protease [Streptomyces indicus]|uniref:Putative serine protease PepD n=1 Tax=Streptomyces indicus TaxID=417292 RepID=A0A1G9HBU1_9ACTN|nr:trypsin-like peptidase domain-containing protein [Streptomyces indicus]SDL10420.1 putative serine protease PepD [Streptomyces indicus]
MTESYRQSGNHPEQQPSPQPSHGQPAYGQSSQPSPDTAYGTPPPAYGAYPPPPAQPPVAPVSVSPGTTVWPASEPAGGGSGGDGGTPANGNGWAAFGHEPAAHPAPAPRKRARGPVAVLAAVALVAAAVGGGTAYAAQELFGNDTTATTGINGTNASAGSKGTVAGVANAVSDSIVEIKANTGSGTSTGSGVIITSDGEIITNNHVIAGASQVQVQTNDGKTYTAEVVGTDSKKDLALLKLKDASGLKAATLGDSDKVGVGDQVVAIGSPEGLTGTVTSGIISALDRDVTVSTDERQAPGQQGDGQWPFEFGGQQFNGDTGSDTTTYKALQTDASLNPGNSGGALIDMNGEIIGINSAMYSPSSSAGSNSGSVGLGFAIPINDVKDDLAKLRGGSMT